MTPDAGQSLTSDDDCPLRSALRYAGGQHCPQCDTAIGIADRWCRWCGQLLRSDPLTCSVTDCDEPAIVRVFPTFGQTPHSGLRCRECLQFDLARDWFEQWADAVLEEGR